jgi:hypothetical protein
VPQAQEASSETSLRKTPRPQNIFVRHFFVKSYQPAEIAPPTQFSSCATGILPMLNCLCLSHLLYPYSLSKPFL